MNDKLIRKSEAEAVVINHHNNGTNADIIKVIKSHAENESYQNEIKDFVISNFERSVKGLEEAFYFFKNAIPYKEDGWEQKIKTPGRAYWDGKKGIGTDCKTFALIMFAVCKHLNISDRRLRLANYDSADGKTPRHIYTVCKLEGNEIILDIPLGTFNKEKKTNYYFDMEINTIAGVKGDITTKNKKIKIGTGSTSIRRNTQKIGTLIELPKADYLPIVNLSEGELSVNLLKRKFELLNQVKGGYDKELELVTESTIKGIHGTNLRKISGVNNQLLQFVTAAQKADYTALNIGNAALEQVRSQYQSCIKKVDDSKNKILWKATPQALKEKEYRKAGCDKYITLERVVNNNLEQSGAALLYQFADRGDLLGHARALSKRGYQQLQHGKITGVTGLSATNVDLFLSNGVIAGLFDEPLKVIKKLTGKGIGCVDPITCAALIAAATAALTAIGKFFTTLNDNGFSDKLTDLIEPDPSTAPSDDDFETKNSQDGEGDREGGDGDGEGEEETTGFFNGSMFGIPNKVSVPAAIFLGGTYIAKKKGLIDF